MKRSPDAKSSRDGQAAPGSRRLLLIVLVLVAAVVMGLPTLRGTFVGGDDHRLVLNHVLVNHPSFAHAIKLFTIIHRDLYQPIPLLSFSLEFALANRLGLFDEGLSGGEWLFHLTNIILHAVNALLVWALIVVWRARPKDDGIAASWRTQMGNSVYGIATIAAVLFAIHPLQVEVVAWVNGRMMLLSTLFALLSVISLGVWLRDGRLRWAIFTVICVTACEMSKVRVGLPLLLVMAPLAQGCRINGRLVLLWVVSAVITGVLVVVNVIATAGAGMFEGAVEHLHGPRSARALMALAWYFQHFAWPTGLAAWYPTPGTVHWSDAAVLRAGAIVLPVLVVIAWAAWRSRVAALGFGWFFVTTASTLPLVPTRNALAADRYMYLPIVGLLWVMGLVLWKLYSLAADKWRPRRAGMVAVPLAAAIGIGVIAVGWHTASFYDSFLQKTLRIAKLFPDTPYAWERVAWAYHSLGHEQTDATTREDMYEHAIVEARKEFVHDDPKIQSDAHVVIGLSQLRLGREDDGIKSLRRAVELNPSGAMTKYRLATALDELGRLDEALSLYEETIGDLRMFNPGINKLAEAYRHSSRPADAERMYKRALENNPYDVVATLGLAELDIESGTRESYQHAERRLIELLDWMPENTTARVNLGVAYAALGRTPEAVSAYERVLEQDPNELTATLNLAQLFQSVGDVARAWPLFERAATSALESIDQALAVHDFFIVQGAGRRAVRLWADFLERFPASTDARMFAAWSRALAGDSAQARAEAKSLIDEGHETALATATIAYASFMEGEYDSASAKTLALCAAGDSGADARRRLLRALELFDQQHPDVPWTYCLAAQLLITDGQPDAARVFADLCEQHCTDPACHDHARSLRARLD
jgi:tetratricopeptide (TPR) repeat protein